MLFLFQKVIGEIKEEIHVSVAFLLFEFVWIWFAVLEY